MRSQYRRKLIVFTVLLAVLGGGAGALAATQGSAGSARKAYLGDVAGRLGVPVEKLNAAIKAADVDRIEAAVAAGGMSRSRAERLKARLQRGAVPPLFAFGPNAKPASGAGGGGLLDVASHYLGIPRATLRGERRAGRSLASIAESTPGRSLQGLKAAILAAATQRLASAVAGGKITAQQQEKRLKRISAHLDKLLARIPGEHARHARRAGHNH